MAIGNPLDLKGTVTSGIISGLNRKSKMKTVLCILLIQTDAAY